MSHGGENRCENRLPAATAPPTAGPSAEALVVRDDGEDEGCCRGEEDWCGGAGGAGVRRPMNAFFLFCKRHRSVVRERYPHLENRAITKILGEWWASLEPHEKHTYTELAKQYKEAFMKANPDFKWCKMPTLPTRSPVTRTKGATTKGDTLRWSPEQTNCPRSDMPRVPTLTKDPLSISRQNNNSPVLQQQGSNSQDEPPATKQMTESGGNAAEQSGAPNPVPSNNPPVCCKPPKKRYLENLENGTYGGGNASRLKSESSPSPSPSPVPCAPLQRAASTDQQTNNACSALLELAEGCQGGKKPPTAGARQKTGDLNAKSQDNGSSGLSSAATSTTTTTSTSTSSNGSSGLCGGGSVPPAGFGPIPMFDVSAANRIIDQAFSQPTTASSTSVTPPPFTALSTSSSGTPPPSSSSATSLGSGCGSSSAAAKARERERFFNVSSALSLAQSLNRGDEEQPLNLCKERPMTTIKTCQQDIINHIIDKFLCGPSNVEPLDGTVFSAHGSSRHPDDSPAVPAVVAAAVPGTVPTPNAGFYRGSADEDGDNVQKKVSAGSHKSGVRRKGLAGNSPSKRARIHASLTGDEDGGSSPERGRKSQRSCKGQRYQALVSEGVLPGSKERKGLVRKSDEEGDDEPSRLGGGGRRDDGAKVPRKNSGTFNLDAQIAALPKCSMESFTRRKNKKKSSQPDDDGRDDCASADAAEPGGKDPDFRTSLARSVRQRSESGASGTDEAVDDPSSPPPASSPSDHSSIMPRKFKTGDFDLDEHLAALPKCDIEVLSRRKKELRRDSGSSSGRQDCKADDSGTESDHAGASESTEENGVREWHSGEEEESEDAGRTSPKKDKRKRRKGAPMEEDFPSSLATLADIALSQKEKMQD
ncbi:HMG box transcription factor BBX isoform X2 [Dermacentor albipictus]|uniref:HMG box transcription factor BBX isoform X2 n=1 Tax=Dermacentor albipictus TaxID=60249 RepID=UPI0031FBD419